MHLMRIGARASGLSVRGALSARESKGKFQTDPHTPQEADKIHLGGVQQRTTSQTTQMVDALVEENQL